jgi:lipopolysaccharide/colanic/teichoic acid biosynthesis glycosyltransferase
MVVEEPAESIPRESLTPLQATSKRAFDMLLAAIGLAITCWLIALAWLTATFETGANGFFTQRRVGQSGRQFTIIKIRTMRSDCAVSSVTVSGDPRITRLGRIWRKLKIDELPQLFNVLVGQMSFVGPRPDVPGFADKLKGKDRIILTVRPGITGPATLKYRNEEDLLASVEDPEDYNREIIYPDKLRLNREYVENWSFRRDIHYIWATISGENDA